jgi:zinc protease
VTAEGAVIIVAGDIDAEDAKREVERHLGRLPVRPGPRAPAPAARAPEARCEISEYRDRKQSAIAIGFPTVSRAHEDWPALRILTHVTSGLAGTFFAELRGRRSLAYTVFATDLATARSGAFAAYLASEASKEQEAREALMAEIRRLPVDGFGEEDLARAKAYLSGTTRIRMQRNSAHVGDLARNRFYGLPLDSTWALLERTQSLTLDQMRAVAGKYVTTDRYAEAVVHGRF